MDDSFDIENSINGVGGIDLEDSEELTSAQVVELMESAWLNEKFCPEILPHKLEIVDCLLGQISYMEDNLESLESTDFQKSLHQMEVDRLRYLITSYLRNRLEKIEMCVFHIFKEEEARGERNEEPYLTDNEFEFAREYKEAMQEQIESITNLFPRIDTTAWKKDHISPNMHSFVFLKSKADIDGVIIDDGNDGDGDFVDIKKESKLIICYKSVSNLVKRGTVQLI